MIDDMRTIFRSLTLAAFLFRPAGAVAMEWPTLSSPAAPVSKGEHDAAVVTAIEKYAFVSPIAGAVENGDAWYDYLTKTLGIPFERVSLLKNEDATREEISAALKKAAGQAGKDGTLWFVFIGHGSPSPDGKGGVLVGVDAQQKASSLMARGLPESETRQILAKSQAGRIRVILDSCFSGRDSSGSSLAPGLQPLVVLSPMGASDPRIAVLTAARGDQFAGPLPGASRPAFSYLALGALRGWTGSKAVTVGDVLDYANKVLSTMVRGRQQVATLSGNPGVPLAPSAGEMGPDLGALQKSASSAAPMFKAAPLAPVGELKAPSALGQTQGMDWKTLDVDALEAYSELVAFDKSDASAAEKFKRWTELALKFPAHKTVAAERARSWGKYAETSRKAVEAAILRQKALEKDWDKLSRLRKMDVIPQKDKEAWTLQFLDAYQWKVGAHADALISMFAERSLDEHLKERESACAAGRQSDCLAAAIMLNEGIGVKKDLSRALALYSSLCDAGFPRGCHNVGRMNVLGADIPKNTVVALESYTKACESGYPGACSNIGLMHYHGQGIPQDYGKAIEYSQKACDMGEGSGCTTLGVAYENGNSVPKNTSRALELYQQACELGELQGCFNVGTVYLHGIGVAQDFERAKTIYQPICEKNHTTACNNLGTMHENGQAMPKDIEKAKELYRKACDLKFQTACDNLRRIGG